MAKSSIGLDIGTSGVRAAEVAFSKTPPSLEGFGQVSLPRGAVTDGEVTDPGTVSEAISQLWKHARFRSKKVAVGIANQKVIPRAIDLPAMSEEELRGAIQFQVQEHIPIPVEDAVIDFQILDRSVTASGEQMMRVFVVAAQRDMVSTIVETVQRAGLDPAAVDVTPLALVRALGTTAAFVGESGAEAIVDIGAGITNIIVHESGVTRFVRILLVGGTSLTDHVAAGLGVSHEDAEGIKQRMGLTADPAQAASGEAAGRLLEQRASAFIEEIRGTLSYYQAQSDAARIARVVVTGGGSKMVNLSARLADVLRLPVEMGRTLQRMQLGKLGLTDAQLVEAEPLMSAAVGLALGDVES